MSFSKPLHPSSWAGKGYSGNSLTSKGKFNPRIPSIDPVKMKEDSMVWMDFPAKLQSRLKKKPQRITTDCLKENAENILNLYEKDIILHVVKSQVNSKSMRFLMLRDQHKEVSDPEKYAKKIGELVCSSSYLGTNPFGDKPMDPTLLVEDEGEEESPDELTAEGSLLKSIQDRCHRYARVHLPRILSSELESKLKEEEQEDRVDPHRLDAYHNKRRPWTYYRELLTEDLTPASGVHELNIILSMDRDTGDTADRWVLRLNIGKEVLQARGADGNEHE